MSLQMISARTEEMRVDYGTLANLVVSLATGAVVALAWLFKLQGDVRVLKSDLKGETELRKSLESRVNGIEERIFDEIQAIRVMLHAMARQQ